MQFESEFIGLKGNLYSKYLGRKVTFRLVAPPHYKDSETPFPVLLMNDGQDFVNLELEKTLPSAFSSKTGKPFVYVGIEANNNRIQEYGTASTPDFKGRGARAKNYSNFLIEEFIPFLRAEFKVSKDAQDWVYCGMSLGGLSAFDIVYNNAQYFGKVGVFSGSFWWRNKAYTVNDVEDRSRIVLDIVKKGSYNPHLKFWFQCGTEDETADRNNNGIIDSIDDTTDVIKELQEKGYSFPGDITYVELDGGKHNLKTWAKVFPKFTNWAFGTN